MQSLSPPLTVSITPNNSHPPQIHTDNLQLDYVENAVLNVLAGVILSDMDETCEEENEIFAAHIEIITVASDNAGELLEVGYK